MRRVDWTSTVRRLTSETNKKLKENGTDFRIQCHENEDGYYLVYYRPEVTDGGKPRPTDPEYPNGSFRTSSIIGQTRKELAIFLRGYQEHLYRED